MIKVRGKARRRSIPEAGYLLVADYLSGDDAAVLLQWLLVNARWRSEHLHMFGRRVAVPRLIAWYGDPGVSYRYSGIDHRADGWPPALKSLLERVREEFAPGVNFALLNRYRSGSDSIGWHTDDEPDMVDPVVSVSLGAPRRLRLRSGGEFNGSEFDIGFDLGDGALLVHARHCPHMIAKTRKPVGERINISFRTIFRTISRTIGVADAR